MQGVDCGDNFSLFGGRAASGCPRISGCGGMPVGASGALLLRICETNPTFPTKVIVTRYLVAGRPFLGWH
eukprot:2235748-Pleurochrysis_carterae.AAC.3